MSPPSVLGGCTVLDRIGVGAESVIYRARRQSTGQIVAIKRVTVTDKESEKYLRHVRNEYAVLKDIQNGPDDSPP